MFVGSLSGGGHSTRAKYVWQSKLTALLIMRSHAVRKIFFGRTPGVSPNSLLNVKHEPSRTREHDAYRRHIFRPATSDTLTSCTCLRDICGVLMFPLEILSRLRFFMRNFVKTFTSWKFTCCSNSISINDFNVVEI